MKPSGGEGCCRCRSGVRAAETERGDGDLVRQLRLILITTLLLPSGLSGQADSVFLADDRSLSKKPERRFCTEAAAPVGLLNGQVEIQFVVGTDGKPDTATVQLLRTNRLSPGSALSAARRFLTACEFRPGHINDQPVRSLLVQRIEFEWQEITVKNGRNLASHQPRLVPAQPSRARLDTTFLETDSLVQERPTQFRCSGAPLVHLDKGFGSVDDPEWARKYGGNLVVSYVVQPNGRIDKTTFRREQGVATDSEEALRRQAEGCEFLPGRIDGDVVNTRVFGYPIDLLDGR